jgi:hypothetical protein
MHKQIIDNFISRYNLNGEIESVKIQSDDKSMNVSFISDDKTLLGTVSSKSGEFPNGEYGIYTTSQLKSLLGVLQTSVKIESADAYVKFSDTNTSVNYMLADLSVIPVVPPLKTLPDFDVEISLDDEFTSKFIKSKGALSESDTFTFECKDGNGKIILGYSTLNTNRISINVDCKCNSDVQPISFSARYLKEILSSNRGAKSGNLKISSKGLAHIGFKTDEIESEYYLVELK